MPILIKNFHWTQTDTHIRVSVPLEAANRRSPPLDLFTQPNFIKINAAPHFFELFLWQPIDTAASTTKVLENAIKFVLCKQQPGVAWPQLERDIAKGDTVASKGAIVERAHNRAEEAAKQRQQAAYELRQMEIRKEIERESAIRQSAEAVHANAFGAEMRAVDGMKEVVAISSQKQVVRVAPANRGVTRAATTVKPSAAVILPRIRAGGSIGVHFSERAFPTPQRESQEAAEQEWILKQNEARKAIGFIEEDLRPEERNVDWLKEKGKDFYAKGNFLGAVSALSTAIRMNPKCYDLYLNRATCHYSLENFNRCVEDASSAFELLVPAVPSNLTARSQCLAKRGAALCKLGYMRQGHDELVAAATLVPHNESLRKDIATVEAALREATN